MTNLETLQSLFNNRAFVIPDYQRGYAWETEQRSDLLSDLEDLAQMDAGKIHYTGTLVVHNGKHAPQQVLTQQYQVCDIVDGQQRLTSLLILLLSVSRALDTISDAPEIKEATQDLRTSYIKRTSLQNTLYRLTLNGDTNLFFKDHIIGDEPMPNPNPATAAQVNLLAAQTQFDNYLKKETDALPDEAARIMFLLNFANRITNRLGFVLYEVETEAEVGVMFEVMNARGRQLTDLEMVKNYLLYLVSRVCSGEALGQLSGDVNQTWITLLKTLSETGSQGSEDQFMRYHWAIYPSAKWEDGDNRARTSDIHKALKKTLNLRDAQKTPADTAQGIKDYLQSLRSLVVSYRDIQNPSHPNAFVGVSGTPSEKERLVETARTLRRTGRNATVLPVLMAAHHTLSQNASEMQEIFRLCETFAFRLGAVERKASTGETRTCWLAAQMMPGKTPSNPNGQISFADAQQGLQWIIGYYCSDYQLQTALCDPDRDFYAWNGLKFFLYEYEKHLTRAAKLHFVIDIAAFFRRPKEDTIEHILPQGASNVPYWSGLFTSDEMASYRNRLGNLCLTNWNGSYSNKPFPEKRGTPSSAQNDKVYQNSTWQNERELCHETDWTKNAITSRQEKLAQFALTRWHI